MKQIMRMLCLGLLTTCLVACEKEKTDTVPADTVPVNPNPEPDPEPEFIVNALVLNEGSWGGNNASITGLDTRNGKVDADWFDRANDGRPLGDVAQDMLKYGSKVYATISFSNSLEVIDPQTGKSQRVDMGDRTPRHIAAEGGKVYITCYNPCSVVRVDTATLEIEATCRLGEYHPEGIAIAQGKAFVASSVMDDYTMRDNKVYVVDLSTFANPETIEVGLNPSMVKKVSDSKILVGYAGDYASIPGGSAIIDATTLQVSQTNMELAGAAIYNGMVYAYASTWVEVNPGDWQQRVGFFQMDPATFSTTPLDFLSGIASPYGIDIDAATGDIYVTESINGANGDVHCYSQSGTLRFKAEAGIFPKKVVVM